MKTLLFLPILPSVPLAAILGGQFLGQHFSFIFIAIFIAPLFAFLCYRLFLNIYKSL